MGTTAKSLRVLRIMEWHWAESDPKAAGDGGDAQKVLQKNPSQGQCLQELLLQKAGAQVREGSHCAETSW